MILYELRCGEGHGFEAWFRNSDAYDEQVAAEQVSCPICGTAHVAKAPMAPHVAKKGGGKGNALAPEEKMRMVMSQIAELNKHIEETCDYVGDNFAEEARKIHYGEVSRSREIYGEATQAEAEKLREEGIKVAAMPKLRRSDS